jgi:hypothetical protein
LPIRAVALQPLHLRALLQLHSKPLPQLQILRPHLLSKLHLLSKPHLLSKLLLLSNQLLLSKLHL